jgi:glycosyltransferase involved in cell wall biosynthesis
MMKFSIVTPSFNQGQFIQKTIESVLAQKEVAVEYLIFDGGSRDNTVSVIEQYAPQLAYWESQPDKGQTNAINKGFARSNGDVLGWLNSDDVFTPAALGQVASTFEANPQADVVYGDSSYMTKEGVMFRTKKARPFSIEYLRRRDFLYQPSTFFRKRIYEKVGPLDERYQSCMDYEYWIRMAEGGAKFVYIGSILSQMRFHEDAKSVNAILLSLKEEKTLKLEYGYPYLQVQLNYYYKRFFDRFTWPIKRTIALFLHERGFSI